MFKLANQVLDAYDDVAHEGIKKLAKLNPGIALMDPNEVEALGDEDFALSVITKKAAKLNKFPIDSHDNAWLSNQYFEMNAHKMPKEAAAIAAYHIKRVCDQFGIKTTASVEGLAKEASSNVYYESDQVKVAQQPKSQEIDLSSFSEIEKIASNYTMAQFAMKTPAHVKLASQYFDQYSDKIPLDWRHKYAAAIQRRAHELGMPAQGGKVIKYASDHYNAHLDGHLASRRSLLEISDPKYLDALQKLGSMKKELEPSRFAQVLHGFDKRAGLDKYYGGYLMDPYLATFGAGVNPNAGYLYKTASGSRLTADEISRVATEKYAKVKEYFGKSVADELQKHGVAIFDSLPKDCKEIIAEIANGSI